MPFITRLYFSVLILLIFFSSCRKEPTNSVRSGDADKTVVSTLLSITGDTTTLTLQPGPNDGQDAYVNTLAGTPSYSQSNYNFLDEIGTSAWTIQGAPLKERTYINFTGLTVLPKGTKILSATLYLYGLDPNTSLSKPQGNSLYPNSPYSRYKTMAASCP